MQEAKKINILINKRIHHLLVGRTSARSVIPLLRHSHFTLHIHHHHSRLNPLFSLYKTPTPTSPSAHICHCQCALASQMGSDDGTPPKLSLLISRPTNPPEMATPPLNAAVSIPFRWEEAPGKPRQRPTESKPKTARALELPPRLLFTEAKVSNVASPTTVLDGPYMSRTRSFTSCNRNASKDHWNGNFGSSRWSSFRRSRAKEEEVVENSSEFSNATADGRTTKVRISKGGIRRSRSFFSNISNSRSHLWASICESLKQVVVPWRRQRHIT